MENNKNKKFVKFQGDMLNFCDFIQVFVFTRNHHLKELRKSKKIVLEKIAYTFNRRLLIIVKKSLTAYKTQFAAIVQFYVFMFIPCFKWLLLLHCCFTSTVNI